MRKNAKDDPNSRFAASVFGFISLFFFFFFFYPPTPFATPSPFREISPRFSKWALFGFPWNQPRRLARPSVACSASKAMFLISKRIAIRVHGLNSSETGNANCPGAIGNNDGRPVKKTFPQSGSHRRLPFHGGKNISGCRGFRGKRTQWKRSAFNEPRRWWFSFKFPDSTESRALRDEIILGIG